MVRSPSPYDAVAYTTRPQAQVHPERLAAMARLHGLDPVPVPESRILELGCGDASNLAAIAAAFPSSRCTGIDRSRAALDRGRRLLRRCGLNQVDLVQADLAHPGAVGGAFDYILCHGLYSWVPEPVRHAILALCRDHLSPRGLAMVSYNTLPGACLRSVIGDMLRWHVRAHRSPPHRSSKARAFLDWLAQNTLDQDELHHALRTELAVTRCKDPGSLFHDELSDHFAPLYFHQFMNHAHEADLQLVADADPADMFLPHLPQRTRRIIGTFSHDRIEQHQYLDFLTGRRFRHTILCHRDLEVSPHLLPEHARRCSFSAYGRALRPDNVPARGAMAVFERAGGVRLETDVLPAKLALQFLLDRSPARTDFARLAERVENRCRELGADDLWHQHGGTRLARFLIEACARRIVTVHGAQPQPPPAQPGRPTAFSLARVQARTGCIVTNLYHQPIRLDDPWSREIVARADGTRSIARLRAELDAHAKSLDRSQADLWRTLRPDLPRALEQLTRRGLLLPDSVHHESSPPSATPRIP